MSWWRLDWFRLALAFCLCVVCSCLFSVCYPRLFVPLILWASTEATLTVAAV